MDKADIRKTIVANWHHFGGSWRSVKYAVDHYQKHPEDLDPELQAAKGTHPEIGPASPSEPSMKSNVVDRAMSEIRRLHRDGLSTEEIIEASRSTCKELRMTLYGTTDNTGWSANSIEQIISGAVHTGRKRGGGFGSLGKALR